MKNVKVISVLLICTFLSACGADIGAGRPPNMSPQTAAILDPMKKRINTLPAQELEKDECMIFLWGPGNTRPLVFTQELKSGSAKALVNNIAARLRRTSAENVIIPGFYENQHFESGNVKVELRIRPAEGRNLYEGIKIPSGILTIKNSDGTDNILPVSGILGCNIGN